jgi:hypothetical protein
MGASHSAPKPKDDLATRAFKNFYFGLAWFGVLTLALRFTWKLRDVFLVWWVYGKAAYFRDGIRVVKAKPTTFSNGAVAPQLPDLVTGFGVFIVTVFGLSLLLISALRFYERIFGKRCDRRT